MKVCKTGGFNVHIDSADVGEEEAEGRLIRCVGNRETSILDWL